MLPKLVFGKDTVVTQLRQTSDVLNLIEFPFVSAHIANRSLIFVRIQAQTNPRSKFPNTFESGKKADASPKMM